MQGLHCWARPDAGMGARPVAWAPAPPLTPFDQEGRRQARKEHLDRWRAAMDGVSQVLRGDMGVKERVVGWGQGVWGEGIKGQRGM